MSYRLHILALLLLSGLPSTASAGFWEGGNPGGDELRGTLKGLWPSSWRLTANCRA